MVDFSAEEELNEVLLDHSVFVGGSFLVTKILSRVLYLDDLRVSVLSISLAYYDDVRGTL